MNCHLCGKPDVALTAGGRYRKHNKAMGAGSPGPCEAHGMVAPGAPAPQYAPEIPGVSPYVEGLQAAAGAEFSQPYKGRPSSPAPVEMTEKGKEITARLKEMFHQYSNRQERSQQATLGPSEIGSPCDRRLAMSLLRLPAVNPGGDNWASFVGTCIHEGLAEMFMWADAGSGRYATELPLTFNTPSVPKGTGDLLDRTMLMFLDHKCMGSWSRNKLKSSGPSDTYRVQVHTYAYGARLRGEQVEHVAIVAWPREASSLDDLYVWTEPYDPAVARDALARVERIKSSIENAALTPNPDVSPDPVDIALAFRIDNTDCKFCPFHKPNAPTSEGGYCNGRE